MAAGAQLCRLIPEAIGTLFECVCPGIVLEPIGRPMMLSRCVCECGLGSIRGRRGSELKVLSAVETKMSGYFASVREMVACLTLLGARPRLAMTYPDRRESQHAFLNKLEYRYLPT